MRHTDTRGSLSSLSVASFISTDILKPISGPLILWTVVRSPPEQNVLDSFSAPLTTSPTPSVQVSSSSTTWMRGIWIFETFQMLIELFLFTSKKSTIMDPDIAFRLSGLLRTTWAIPHWVLTRSTDPPSYFFMRVLSRSVDSFFPKSTTWSLQYQHIWVITCI